MEVGNICNSENCNFCQKKLKLVSTFKCKCGFNFCKLHRLPEQHECTYDYKNEGKINIEKNNPLIKNNKIITF